jgi:hypothetical protein
LKIEWTLVSILANNFGKTQLMTETEIFLESQWHGSICGDGKGAITRDSEGKSCERTRNMKQQKKTYTIVKFGR